MPETEIVKLYPPDYSKVPGNMTMNGAIFRYLEHGIQPGHFLTAVICNNLKEAFSHADSQNQELMHEWVKFFYNDVQSDAWGSPEKMEIWLDSFDEDGHLKDE
jgi:hypothetical protein